MGVSAVWVGKTVAHAGSDAALVPPFTPLRLLTEATLDPVMTTGLLLAAAAYLWGVRRLRARGDEWSTARTAAWLLGGLGSIAATTLSGVAAYENTLFSVHMMQHMVLSMVAPVFLALGAPVTLALRTLPAGGRQVMLDVLHSRAVRVLTFPLIPFLLFVASPFALYFTGWYPATLGNEWLHQGMHLHFLLVGCLFFWPLVGLDPVPGQVAHPLRMLILVATLPLHAILGLTIMNESRLIAGTHYLSLDLFWSDPVSEQRVGGGLLWASGDLVGLIMLGAAAYQWMRASEREGVREDRRLDRLEQAGTAAPEDRPGG